MVAYSKKPTTLVNSEITPPRVRVEVRHGPNLGIMSTPDALAEARRRGIDLVLRAPSIDPPLCEIMDMSRYIYNDQIAEISYNAAPLSAPSLFDIPLPENSKAFLNNVGLPDRFIEFRIDYVRNGLLRLDEYVEWWREIEHAAFKNTCHRLGREPNMCRSFIAPNPVDLSCYYRIGESDIGNTLSIERDTGNIYLIDIAGFQSYSPPGFINSNVMLLSQFMNLVSNATDADRATLRSELTALDPNAMGDLDGGFWSTLVEEFEYGIW